MIDTRHHVSFARRRCGLILQYEDTRLPDDGILGCAATLYLRVFLMSDTGDFAPLVSMLDSAIQGRHN